MVLKPQLELSCTSGYIGSGIFLLGDYYEVRWDFVEEVYARELCTVPCRLSIILGISSEECFSLAIQRLTE